MLKKLAIHNLVLMSLFLSGNIVASAKTKNDKNVDQTEYRHKHHLPKQLQKYIAHIQDTHHAIRYIKGQKDIAHESVREAQKAWRPQVTAQGYFGRTRIDSNATNERFRVSAKSHQFTISQPVYSGDRIGSDIRLSKSQLKETEEQTRNDIDQFLFQSSEAYISYFKNRALVLLHDEAVSNAEKRLHSVKVEKDAGERTVTDVAIAESRLANAKADLAKAKADLATARVNFTYYTGTDQPFDLESKEDFLHLNTDFTPPDIGYLYQHNAQIRKANAEINSAKENIKRAKAEYAASVTLDATASFNDRRDEIGRRIDSEDYSLLARYNIPLYGRGVEYSREKTARLQEVRSKNRLIALSGDISSEYQSNVLAFYAAKSIVKSYVTALETAKKAALAATKEYEYGFRSITELYDAEREVTEAESKLIGAKADKLSSMLLLLRDLGQLCQL